MPIQYDVVANTLKADRYYPRVVPGKRVPLDRLIDDIVAETTLSDADIRAVLTALRRHVVTHLSDGDTPELDGLVSFGISLGEDLPGADTVVSANVDVRVNAQPAASLVAAVRERATLEKTYTRTRQPVLTALIDVQSGAQNVYTPGNIVRLRGDDLKFNAGADDEGVFFVPGSGRAARIDTYAQSGNREVMFLAPATLSGDYTVEVRTRYGTDTLRVGRLGATVRAAADAL